MSFRPRALLRGDAAAQTAARESCILSYMPQTVDKVCAQPQVSGLSVAKPTGARSRPRNDPPHRPPHHHLPLQAAGLVRRASHDVPSARQLRPEAAGSLAHHRARAHRPCAGCTTCSATAWRSPSSASSPSKVLRFESTIWLDHAPSKAPDFEIEDYAKTYPFAYAPEELPDLAPGDDARSTPIRTRRSTAGCASSCARTAPTDTGTAADDAHLRLQGELHLRAPLRARHARSRPRRCGSAAAAAAIWRC